MIFSGPYLSHCLSVLNNKNVYLIRNLYQNPSFYLLNVRNWIIILLNKILLGYISLLWILQIMLSIYCIPKLENFMKMRIYITNANIPGISHVMMKFIFGIRTENPNLHLEYIPLSFQILTQYLQEKQFPFYSSALLSFLGT